MVKKLSFHSSWSSLFHALSPQNKKRIYLFVFIYRLHLKPKHLHLHILPLLLLRLTPDRLIKKNTFLEQGWVFPFSFFLFLFPDMGLFSFRMFVKLLVGNKIIKQGLMFISMGSLEKACAVVSNLESNVSILFYFLLLFLWFLYNILIVVQKKLRKKNEVFEYVNSNYLRLWRTKT